MYPGAGPDNFASGITDSRNRLNTPRFAPHMGDSCSEHERKLLGQGGQCQRFSKAANLLLVSSASAASISVSRSSFGLSTLASSTSRNRSAACSADSTSTSPPAARSTWASMRARSSCRARSRDVLAGSVPRASTRTLQDCGKTRFGNGLSRLGQLGDKSNGSQGSQRQFRISSRDPCAVRRSGWRFRARLCNRPEPSAAGRTRCPQLLQILKSSDPQILKSSNPQILKSS